MRSWQDMRSLWNLRLCISGFLQKCTQIYTYSLKLPFWFFERWSLNPKATMLHWNWDLHESWFVYCLVLDIFGSTCSVYYTPVEKVLVDLSGKILVAIYLWRWKQRLSLERKRGSECMCMGKERIPRCASSGNGVTCETERWAFYGRIHMAKVSTKVFSRILAFS